MNKLRKILNFPKSPECETKKEFFVRLGHATAILSKGLGSAAVAVAAAPAAAVAAAEKRLIDVYVFV